MPRLNFEGVINTKFNTGFCCKIRKSVQPKFNTDTKNKHPSVHGRHDDPHVCSSLFACMFCFLSVDVLWREFFLRYTGQNLKETVLQCNIT